MRLLDGLVNYLGQAEIVSGENDLFQALTNKLSTRAHLGAAPRLVDELWSRVGAPVAGAGAICFVRSDGMAGHVTDAPEPLRHPVPLPQEGEEFHTLA